MNPAPSDGRRSVELLSGEQEYGAVPVNDRQAEQIVLGALMLAADGGNESAIDEIMNILREHGGEAFYRPAHGVLYDHLVQLRREGQSIAPVSVARSMDAELRRVTGGAPYLHTCIQQVPTVPNAPLAAKTVLECYTLRRVQALGTRTVQRSLSAAPREAGDLLDSVRRDLDEITVGGRGETMRLWTDASLDVVNASQSLAHDGVSADEAPISSGFVELDEYLNGGFRAGQLVLWAGRPGSGKSLAGLAIAHHSAMILRRPFPWFTAEMSTLECAQRVLSAGARVAHHSITNGTLTEEDWAKTAKYLEETEGAPLGFDDHPSISTGYIDGAIPAFMRHFPGQRLGGIGGDYAQIFTPDADLLRVTREQQVAGISRRAKQLARKYGCPFHLLAQLNRGPEQRTDKTPLLSDLRESGGLEQDADVVILLYRDDYYNPESERAGEIDFIIAKNRGGRTGTVTVAAQLHQQRLVDMAM